MKKRAAVRAAEYRTLGPSGIEDYHAHLMRLDRGSHFPRTDDRAIDTHCLQLVAAQAILVGAYIDGVMRAGAEIVPDRTARSAEAAITIEDGFQDRGLERELTERVIDAARRHHIHNLRVQEQSATRTYRIPPFELQVYAANG